MATIRERLDKMWASKGKRSSVLSIEMVGEDTVLQDVLKDVDRAGELKTEIDKKTDELENLKKKLKASAKDAGLRVLQGSEFVCTFKDQKKTEVDDKKFFKFLWDEGRIDEVHLMVKPSTKMIKKHLSGEEVDSFSTQKESTYHSITFTKIKEDDE